MDRHAFLHLNGLCPLSGLWEEMGEGRYQCAPGYYLVGVPQGSLGEIKARSPEEFLSPPEPVVRKPKVDLYLRQPL